MSVNQSAQGDIAKPVSKQYNQLIIIFDIF